MPAYVNSPFASPKFLLDGVNTYLFGSYNAHQANTRIFVSTVALAANVATVTGTIVEGEIPVVGAYVSILGTQTSAGLFNVKRAIVTASSFNASTGVGSVSFALTGANVSATVDAGTAIVEVPEVAETLVAGASISVALPPPDSGSQRTLTTRVIFPTVPTACTVSLQVADRDVDSEYTTVQTAAVVSGSAQTSGPYGQFTLTRGNFARFVTSGITGSGTLVATVA